MLACSTEFVFQSLLKATELAFIYMNIYKYFIYVYIFIKIEHVYSYIYLCVYLYREFKILNYCLQNNFSFFFFLNLAKAGAQASIHTNNCF